MLVSHHSFQVKAPPMVEQSIVLIEIERLMRERQFTEAKSQLLKMDVDDDFVRKFLVECILETEDFDLAIKVFNEPKTNSEIIVLLNASIQLKDKSRMAEYIEKFRPNSLSNPSIKELIKKMEVITR